VGKSIGIVLLLVPKLFCIIELSTWKFESLKCNHRYKENDFGGLNVSPEALIYEVGLSSSINITVVLLGLPYLNICVPWLRLSCVPFELHGMRRGTYGHV
jgi:hypothetical protein